MSNGFYFIMKKRQLGHEFEVHELFQDRRREQASFQAEGHLKIWEIHFFFIN